MYVEATGKQGEKARNNNGRILLEYCMQNNIMVVTSANIYIIAKVRKSVILQIT